MGFICSQTQYLQHCRPTAHKLDKSLLDMMVKNMKLGVSVAVGHEAQSITNSAGIHEAPGSAISTV